MSIKKNLAVLASGNGSNFQALWDATQRGALHAKIALLITDNPRAYAITRAKQLDVPVTLQLPLIDRRGYGLQLIDTLESFQTDWICLAGFMRLLDPVVIRAFPQRIVNIHPSLLPAFPGLAAIAQAWTANAPYTGCTVHYVDEGIDTGPIIAQTRVDRLPADTLESLTERIHAAEHALYPRAVQWVLEGNTEKMPDDAFHHNG